MTTAELALRLEQEGCSSGNYSINTRSYDGFCLVNDGFQWAVFYSERGRDQTPIFTSINESEACQFYFDFVLNMRHDHLVGFLRSEKAARALQAQLAGQGIPTHADRMLYGHNDYRHRIMVVGKDVFKARELLGTLPLTDTDDAKTGVWNWLRQYFA